MGLIPPYGGAVKNLIVEDGIREKLRASAVYLPSWYITLLLFWDIVLRLKGAFSPLVVFIRQEYYLSVC